jgi:hypothetical protein
MIRLQEVLLSLAAGGIVAALVASGRTGSGDRGWDPRESQAALFRSQDAMPVGASYSSTAPTLRKWAGSALSPHVRLATFKPGEVRGVRVSLTSTPDHTTAVGVPGCFAPATSVVGPPPNTANCSAFSGPPANNLGQCSVLWNSTTLPSGTPNCSSTGLATNGGNGMCSAGSGSPTNSSTGNNTTFCSVTNGQAGTGAQTACSAADSAGAGSQCTAMQGGQNAGSYCSVGATGTNSQCSTGSAASPAGLGGTCSTIQNGAGTNGSAQCSVKTGQQGSSCSSTQAGEKCSVGTSGPDDFCSVQADPNNSNNCTALTITQSGTCSVIVSGATGTCSGVRMVGGMCYSK